MFFQPAGGALPVGCDSRGAASKVARWFLPATLGEDPLASAVSSPALRSRNAGGGDLVANWHEDSGNLEWLDAHFSKSRRAQRALGLGCLDAECTGENIFVVLNGRICTPLVEIRRLHRRHHHARARVTSPLAGAQRSGSKPSLSGQNFTGRVDFACELTNGAPQEGGGTCSGRQPTRLLPSCGSSRGRATPGHWPS